MERLIEIIRRFALVGVWLVGGGISAALFIASQDHGILGGVAIGTLVLTWVGTKIINWIMGPPSRP